MAFAAFHFHMLANERKTRLFKTVVEPGIFPVALVMAVLAITSQAALVFVVLAMTVDAS